MSLVGFRHIEASDPGTVGAGYQWLDTTTGNLYERDTSDIGWVFVGNVNSTNYGMLSLTGGAMSGAITGVSGWAPETSPGFSTSATLDGVGLATVNDLATLQSNLETMITDMVSSEIASSSSNVSINNNIVITCGTMPASSISATSTIVLPTPIFPDGIQATAAQCFSIISPLNCTTIPGNFINEITFERTGSSNLEWRAYVDGGGDVASSLNYIIIAVR
jgi:hypothetical protein